MMDAQRLRRGFTRRVMMYHYGGIPVADRLRSCLNVQHKRSNRSFLSLEE